jgi:hypothetical protein
VLTEREIEMATFKERLYEELIRRADERGRVNGTVDEIRKTLNQDRHDAIKNLWELKRSGFIDYSVMNTGSQAIPDQITVLKKKKTNSLFRARRASRRGSVTPALLEYLENFGGGQGEWVEVKLKTLAVNLGIGYEALTQAVRRLNEQAILDIDYHGKGARSGVKALRLLGRVPRVPVPQVETPVAVANGVSTPLLDEYRAARDFAAKHPNNPYIVFEPIPIVEEALAMIDSDPGKAI